MNLWTLARRLGFSRKLTVQLCWEAIRRDMAALQRSIRTASIPEYFALQKQVGHRAMLAAGLHTACRAWKQYRRKGISEQVFWDTMGCFSRFMEETRVRFGEYRFDRGWWTWRQLEQRQFRLGQLEYELCGTVDDLRVAMHIPSDADLSPEAWRRPWLKPGRLWRSFIPGGRIPPLPAIAGCFLRRCCRI